MATARDLIFIVAIIFAFGLGFLILHMVSSTMVNQLLSKPAINSSAKAVEAFNGVKTTANRLDYVVFSVFIGLLLAMIIASWFVAGSPIFVFIYFLIIVLCVVVSAVFSNVWEIVSTSSWFASSISAFPLTNALLLRYPYYMAIVGFVGVIIMFAKTQSQSGY